MTTSPTYPIDPRIAAASDQVLTVVLQDPAVEEIMYNGPGRPLMILHRERGPMTVGAPLDDAYARFFAEHVATQGGATLGPTSPVYQGALPDGSRIHITAPPVSPAGITFTIRKFLVRELTLADMVADGVLDATAAAFLWSAVDGLGRAPMNLLVVGGTGTGKTTFLNALTHLMPLSDRLVIIEDTLEIRVMHGNAVRLVASAEHSMDELLRGALRMRPDRILVGEVRGPEAGTLLTAMNTGHRGCLGTLHANTASESLDRLQHAPMAVPVAQLMGLDLVLSLGMDTAGAGRRRVVTEIVEVVGHGEGVVRTNRLFAWDPKRRVLAPTGIPSRKRALLAQAAGLDHRALSSRLGDRAARLGAWAHARPSATTFAAEAAHA